MKKHMTMLLIVFLGITFIIPVTGHAWRGGTSVAIGFSNGWGPGYGAGYRGGWGRPYRPYGWPRPRVYLGAAFVNPLYFPAPVYVSKPTVVYTGPVNPPAYAYPDPALTGQNSVENPPGEWITVPGQWVNGQWVPLHKTWVPVNP